MQVCRNCGSTEIYAGDITPRVNAWFQANWYFKLQVCTGCGLSEWFLTDADFAWVKENFSPVNPAANTSPSDSAD
jgi:predicted nucleic-acid-binding Zn-ribbon protein